MHERGEAIHTVVAYLTGPPLSTHCHIRPAANCGKQWPNKKSAEL